MRSCGAEEPWAMLLAAASCMRRRSMMSQHAWRCRGAGAGAGAGAEVQIWRC